MTDLLFDDPADFRDNWGLWLHRAAVEELGLPAREALEVAARHGRDKARTPMHWSGSPNGGFSPAGISTWLPVNANHAAGINVAAQRQDPGSLLRFYRRLLEVRRRHAALSRGACTLLDADAPDHLAYLRSADGRSCLVALNTTDHERSIELGLPDGERRLLVSSRVRPPVEDARTAIRLEAYEAYVAEIAPTAPSASDPTPTP
jgi:glycosidase